MMTPGVMMRSSTFGPSTSLILAARIRIPASSGSRSGTVLSMDANPRVRNITASVAMNGCTLKYWISTPDASPNSPPIAIMTSTTSQPFQPAL